MKIALLLPGRGYSGGVRVALRMASELTLRGHDVKALYKTSSSRAKTLARQIRDRLKGIAPDWVSLYEGDCLCFRKLTSEIVGHRDVILSIGPDCVEEMMELPEECGYKIFNAHGLTLRNAHLREVAWKRDVPKIAVSHYVRSEMEKHGIHDVYAVVQNGIDKAEYYPDDPEDLREAVGTVYGPGFAKDPETILSVFSQLHEQRPEIPLVCFSSSPRPEGLSAAVEYHRLPDMAAARKLYSRCGVWFCASRSEGFPGPVLEAMACGCAMVCTDCGGPGEYLQSGVNSIQVEKESPEKIVKAILQIRDDESLRKQLVEGAMKTLQEYTWPAIAAKMEKVLQGMISGEIKCPSPPPELQTV